MPDKKIEVLYITSFTIHVLVCFGSANTDPFPLVANTAIWLVSIYEKIGFHWSDKISYILAVSLISGVVLSVLRRYAEGVISGWPRFKNHDYFSFFLCWIRCLCYMVFVFFVIGAWGSNRSSDFESLYALNVNYEPGFIDIFLISLSSFIICTVVNVVDDAISSTVILIKGMKQ